MKAILTLIMVAAAVGYLVFSFVCWNFNVGQWPMWWRLSYGLCVLFMIFWLLINTSGYAKHKAEQKKREDSVEAQKNRQAGGFAGLLQKQLDAAEEARRNITKP